MSLTFYYIRSKEVHQGEEREDSVLFWTSRKFC